MSGTATVAQIAQASLEERLEAIATIWNSILDDGEVVGVSPEFGAELDRRLENFRKNGGTPWEVIRERRR